MHLGYGLRLRHVCKERLFKLHLAPQALDDAQAVVAQVVEAHLVGHAEPIGQDSRGRFEGQIDVFKKSDNSDGKKFRVIENESIEEIKKAIAKKKNIFIFSLRKGLATMTVCRDCNEMLVCEK